MSLDVHIRWMVRRDMPEVMAIEREAFEFPWSESDFLQWLRSVRCIGLVAEHKKRVVGFVVYELHEQKIHLANIAVAKHIHRMGVGSKLCRKLIGTLTNRRRSRIFTTVRESNVAAQMFFAANGFRATGTIARLYDETDEDAYTFTYDINRVDVDINELCDRLFS